MLRLNHNRLVSDKLVLTQKREILLSKKNYHEQHNITFDEFSKNKLKLIENNLENTNRNLVLVVKEMEMDPNLKILGSVIEADLLLFLYPLRDFLITNFSIIISVFYVCVVGFISIILYIKGKF